MKKIFLILSFLTSMAVQAQETTFKVKSPQTAVAGKVFMVEYMLEGSSDEDPVLEETTDIEVFSGPSKSMSMHSSMVNGKQTIETTSTYTYRYTAGKAGTFNIPRLTLQDNGKVYRTGRYTITILAGEQNEPDRPERTQVSHGSEDTAPADGIFFRWILSSSSVYENEGLRATLKLYSAGNRISGIGRDVYPGFNGFLIEEISIHGKSYPTVEKIDGRSYQAYIVRDYLLYPLRQGTLTIEQGTFEILVQAKENRSGFDNFFNTTMEDERRQVTSPAVSIQVRPYPAGAPASFRGAVGKYGLSASLDKTFIPSGDSVRLTIDASGTGNIRMVPVDISASGFEIRDRTVANKTQAGASGMSGTKEAVYTLMPAGEGTLNIHIPGITYLDPATGTYHTTNDTSLVVTAGERPRTAGDTPVNIRMDDVDPGQKKLLFLACAIMLVFLSVMYLHLLRKRNLPLAGHVLFIGGMAALAFGMVALSSVFEETVQATRGKPDEQSVSAIKGMDIIYALDISTSMLQPDLAPNRLAAVRQAIMPASDPDNRTGLVLFAEECRLACPLTEDPDLFMQALDHADSCTIGRDGTATGMALVFSLNALLQQESGKTKCIILLTDGRNNCGRIGLRTAVEIAQQYRVCLVIAGIGPAGNPASLTAEDETLLRELAHSTGGTYYRARNTHELDEVCSLIWKSLLRDKVALPEPSDRWDKGKTKLILEAIE